LFDSKEERGEAMFMTDILGRCSTLEQRVADIYTQFASSLPQDAMSQKNFWLGLAAEERQHGRVLVAEKIVMEADMDSGSFLPEYSAKLVSLDAALKQIEAKANQGVNTTEAFSLALDLEQSELNTIYRDLVLTGRGAGRLRAPDLLPGLSLSHHHEHLVSSIGQFLPHSETHERAKQWLAQQRYPLR
jgi:acetylglutamate synthase